MGLPLTTTTITVQRWSRTDPGTLEMVESAVPSVVGRISGKELWAFKGIAASGWREDLTSKLNTDSLEVSYNDIITDDGTGERYRVIYSTLRQGLGMDHMEAGLASYAPTGLYSLYRGTGVDQWGDAAENSTEALWSAVAGEIREVQRDTQLPVTQQPNTVRRYEGRFPVGMDIKVNDRITNDDTDVTYTVVGVGHVSDEASADVGVELMKVTE